MKIDYSPLVASAQTDLLKVFIAVLVFVFLYALVALSLKRRIGRRVADLLGTAADATGFLGAMYVGFVLLAH